MYRTGQGEIRDLTKKKSCGRLLFRYLKNSSLTIELSRQGGFLYASVARKGVGRPNRNLTRKGLCGRILSLAGRSFRQAQVDAIVQNSQEILLTSALRSWYTICAIGGPRCEEEGNSPSHS